MAIHVPTDPLFDDELGASTPKTAAGIGGASDGCSCGLVAVGGPADVYNEEAFRYFLDVERKRSEISNRPFLLLLVDVKKQVEMDAPQAGSLFDALSVGLRETDFAGWYREGSVVGAVLTQHSSDVGTDGPDVVSRRVARVLQAALPEALASRLQIRVYQIPPTLQNVSE